LIQYLQHSSVIEGPGFESFIEELRKHADQEKDHAIKIADRISFLGGVPTLVVNPMSSSSDPVELLKIELRAEDEAIKYYKERIAQADQLQDYGTSHLIKSILIEEEEHRLDLITILGNNL
jgi:bacterioferritin